MPLFLVQLQNKSYLGEPVVGVCLVEAADQAAAEEFGWDKVEDLISKDSSEWGRTVVFAKELHLRSWYKAGAHQGLGGMRGEPLERLRHLDTCQRDAMHDVWDCAPGCPRGP